MTPQQVGSILTHEPGITVFSYSEKRIRTRLNNFVLDLETYSLRNSVISFETRIRLVTKIRVEHKLNLSTFIKFRSKYGVALAIANSRLIRIVSRRFLRFLGATHHQLSKICRESNPHLILCFSGGIYSGAENSICRFGRLKRVPVFLAIDNWDNLSSKSVLWEKPSVLGVWGPAMARDAVSIHGIHPSRIIEIGSSRVDISKNNDVVLAKTQNPYVLFAGSGIQHIDEVAALVECRMAMNKLGYSDTKLIYRPHPWMLRGKEGQQDFRLSSIDGIELDPDIQSKGEDSFYDLASLTYLEDLVKGAEFLIAGHSTVIVEALYYGKKVLAFNGSDHPLFSNHDSWSIYCHMQQVSQNPHLFRCADLASVDSVLLQLINDTSPSMNYVPDLIPNFNNDFNTRVVSALNSITV